MKKRFFLFFLLCYTCSLLGASFQIRSLDIEAQLEKDASMQVKEIITYDVGEINGILFDLDAKGNGPLVDFSVYATDENGTFQEIPKNQIELSMEDELYHLKIYARTENRIRQFAILYHLSGGAKVYDDIGEINRIFVGRNWQSPIDQVTVKVNLPETIPQESIQAFGHGPLTGNVEIHNHRIQYELKDYYPGDFVEAHILFNPDTLEKVPSFQRVHEKAKARLLEEEETMAEKANAEREYYQKLQKQGNILFGVEATFILSLVALAKFLLRRAPKPKIELPEYLRELPDDNSPAIVGKLFHKDDSSLLFPSLMDLVRRKYLFLETRGNEQYLVRNSNPPSHDSLKNYEKELLEIYINQLGEKGEVNLSFLAHQKIGNSISGKILHWGSFLEQEYRSKHFSYRSSAWKMPFVFLVILLIFASLIAIERFDDVKFMLFIPVLFVFVLPYILKSTFPSEETQITIQKWEAFKKFLSDYSLLNEANITSIHLWEHYFVYALVLGVAEQVAKAYEFAIQRGNLDLPPQNAFHYAPCLYSYRHQPGIERTIQNTYHRSVSSIARSQRSSRSGFSGGGFSSGSSGGGGGRGGGGAF